jgi:uncharacterized phage protein (TIGR02220 family)
MENKGWIKLHRKIVDNPLWLSEPFTKAQAWVDLLLLANHKDGHIRKRGVLVTVERGQVGYSEEALAERWKWSRGKVRRYVVELARLSQVSRKISKKTVQKKTSVSSFISITNYEAYQMNGTEDGTENGRKTVQEQEEKERKEKYIPGSVEVLSYLNEKTGRKYRTAKYIQARLKDGATVDDCRRVIDAKIGDPYFIQNPQYLNPETIFRPGNFDKYLNQLIPIKPESPKSNHDSSCPRCGAQIPPQDRTGQGCIHCEAQATA